MIGLRSAGSGLGVTVLPEWIQADGVNAVLDRLEAGGVNMVATSPYVVEPVIQVPGIKREPRAADQQTVPVMDPPLWGKRTVSVPISPSFPPTLARYIGLKYQPPLADQLTQREGAVVRTFLEDAKRRGMTTHLQVQAASPPGYRIQFGNPHPDDEMLCPDGKPILNRVDTNGSLASPDILAYGEAMLADLAEHYPSADAIRLNWPEIPLFNFGALLFDFSPHALRVANRMGIDVAQMRADTLAVRGDLRTLTDPVLQGVTAEAAPAMVFAHAGFISLLNLRRQMVVNMLARYRAVVPQRMALVPQASPPPFHRLSGFDYSDASEFSDAIGVKLYTTHWPMILRDWGEALRGLAPRTSSREMARALVRLTWTGGPLPDSLDVFRYPDPGEPHRATNSAIGGKIQMARAQAGTAPVAAFTHAYGPLHDVVRRFRVAWEASDRHVWINRYQSLTDDKLEAIRKVVSLS